MHLNFFVDVYDVMKCKIFLLLPYKWVLMSSTTPAWEGRRRSREWMIALTWLKPAALLLYWVRTVRLYPTCGMALYFVVSLMICCMLHCVSSVGLKNDFQSDVFKMVAGILHLGNVVIKAVGSDQSSINVRDFWKWKAHNAPFILPVLIFIVHLAWFLFSSSMTLTWLRSAICLRSEKEICVAGYVIGVLSWRLRLWSNRSQGNVP